MLSVPAAPLYYWVARTDFFEHAKVQFLFKLNFDGVPTGFKP